MTKFDLIVIGAGPGGYVAAIKAARQGISVAVVEEDKVGGTCLNRGCIPAKAMIHASSLYREILDESSIIGINVSGASYDYSKIVEYKQNTSNTLVSGIEGLFKGNKIQVLKGHGVLEADGSVTVHGDEGTEKYEASKVLLATGSVPSLIPIPGIDLPGVITSDGVFQLEEAPESLVIIGGGVIGVEFATVYANLGIKVTVIEALPRVLQNMDKEISQNLKMIFKKKGIEIHAGAMVKSILKTDSGLAVNYVEKDKECVAEGQYVICAAGRKPNLEGVFGEGVEIAMDGKLIDTDERKGFKTSMDNVYAIGDIVPGIKLAHTASAQGVYCIEKMFDLEPSVDVNVIPSCVYTDPEIAQVGITDVEAKEAGIEVNVGKFIMSANGKSVITNEERGFIKVVADAETDKVLGAQMMCARATDMISEFATAIVNGLTVDQMLNGVRPHPTYNEGIAEALESVHGESLHTIPKKKR